MRNYVLCFLLLISGHTFGKTTYIEADKLPANQQNNTHFQFIREQEKYVDHVSPKWEYSVSKATLAEGLRKALDYYAAQDASNLEVNLLLGDISTYLHNLSEPGYFESAEKYYKKAAQLAPLDFRAFWFLAELYASANDAVRSVEHYRMAQSRLPKAEPAGFWEAFAREAYEANMPTTSLYAMDRAKALLNRPSDFERINGSSVRARLTDMSSLRTYTNKELWTYTEGDKVTFSSRPLGLKVNIEPDWELNITGFNQKKTTFTMVPPAVTGSDGQEATFSMSIVTKVASEDEDLRAFLNSLITGKPEKKEIDFSDKYPYTVSYELKDPEQNKTKGGSHMYLIGIKRKQPLYPGLSMEQPEAVGIEGETPRQENAKNRFGGTIFYAVLLDAPEDVFPTAKRTFWDVFVNQLFIE